MAEQGQGLQTILYSVLALLQRDWHFERERQILLRSQMRMAQQGPGHQIPPQIQMSIHHQRYSVAQILSRGQQGHQSHQEPVLDYQIHLQLQKLVRELQKGLQRGFQRLEPCWSVQKRRHSAEAASQRVSYSAAAQTLL
jgi:hypothetical protein